MEIPEVLVPPLSKMECMPDDVLLEVFGHLNDPYDAVMCGAASRRLQEIVRHQQLWRSYCRRKYSTPQLALYGLDWKRMFDERNGFGNPFRAQRAFVARGHASSADEIAAVAVQGRACLVAQGSHVHVLHLNSPPVDPHHLAAASAAPQPPPQGPWEASNGAAWQAAPPEAAAPTGAAAATAEGEIPAAAQQGPGSRTGAAGAGRGSGAFPAAHLCASVDCHGSTPTALSFLPGTSAEAGPGGVPACMHAVVGTLQGGLHHLTLIQAPAASSQASSYASTVKPLISSAQGSGGGIPGGGGSIPISQLYSMSAAQNAPVAALHDAFLNTHQLVQGSPASFVEFVDVAAQRRTGVAREVMDSWAFVTITCPAGGSSCSCSGGTSPSAIRDSTASTANPHVLLAGSVSRFHCSRCWEAYLPWLCSHKHHTALAALCVCDTRLPGYVAERFALQHRSLYPHLSTARGEYVFTSHADCPLAVWDLRRMSVPVFASNSRNLDHQTEGPLGGADSPAPNQAMFLDASEDLLLGQALNGTLWLWDLAELLGWQDGSGGLGVWEALDYLSPWESHSLPPKAWPLCLGALHPGANYLPVTCLLQESNPTSLLVVTDPRSLQISQAHEEEDGEHHLHYVSRHGVGVEEEEEEEEEEDMAIACRARLADGPSSGEPCRASAVCGGLEGPGSWYSGTFGPGVDCSRWDGRGHAATDCRADSSVAAPAHGLCEGMGCGKSMWQYAAACGRQGIEEGAGMSHRQEGDATGASRDSEEEDGQRGVEGGWSTRAVDERDWSGHGVEWVGGGSAPEEAAASCETKDASREDDWAGDRGLGEASVKEAAGCERRRGDREEVGDSVRAATALCAGGFGEQLVRISFCRRPAQLFPECER